MTPGIISLGDFSISGANTLTGTPILDLDGLFAATIDARLAYGSGGISVIAKIQTSINQGTTWIDIARFDFATAGLEKIITVTKASIVSAYTVIDLAAEGGISGVLGDRLRCVVTSTGTYTGSTTLAVRASVS